MRTHHSQLPDAEELKKIIEMETKREVSDSKKGLHFASFELFIKFCQKLGIDTSAIKLNIPIEEAAENGTKILNKVISELKKRDLTDLKSTLEDLYDYLAEEDKLEKADLIFVFGSQQPNRAEKGIELFKSGYAPKILFSGRSPFYEERRPEAEIYKEMAINEGISEQSIIAEPKSITIIDNVRSSLNLLEQMKMSCESMILVMVPYGQRRGSATMQKYLHNPCKLIRCNSTTNDNYRRETWYKTEESQRVVLNEYIKIWLCSNGDVI